MLIQDPDISRHITELWDARGYVLFLPKTEFDEKGLRQFALKTAASILSTKNDPDFQKSLLFVDGKVKDNKNIVDTITAIAEAVESANIAHEFHVFFVHEKLFKELLQIKDDEDNHHRRRG